MKAVAISVLVAIAIVLTVAILPASNWVFRNEIDLLTRTDPNRSQGNVDVMDYYMPDWIDNPNTYTGTDPAEELTRATFTKYPFRREALATYTKSHPDDLIGWTVSARMACMAGARDPDRPTKYPANRTNAEQAEDAAREKEADLILAQGLEAAINGERLEPQNAYFPLMRAVFDKELNRFDDLPKALASAANKPDYNDHLRDQALVMEKAQRLAKGYRGEHVRMGMGASLMLPDFAHIKSLGRYLNRKGTLAEKRDMIQTASLIGQGSSASIGYLIALAEMRSVLKPPVPVDAQDETKRSDSDWHLLASGFDGRLRASNIAPPIPGTVATYDRLDRLVNATKKYVDSRESVFIAAEAADKTIVTVFIQSFVPPAALAAILFSIVFSLGAWVFTRVKSDVFRQMAPHLASIPGWLIVTWLSSSCDDCSATMAGICFGVAQLSLAFLRLEKRPAGVFTGLIAVGALVMARSGPFVLSGLPLCTAALCVVLAVLPWLLDTGMRARVATITALALAVLSLFGADHSASLSGVIFVWSMFFLLKKRSGETPKFANWSTVAAFLVISAVAGAAFFQCQLNHNDFRTCLAAIGLLGLVAAMAFTCKTVQLVKIATCVSLMVFSATYLVAVGVEVRENHKESLNPESLMDETKAIRKLAGLGG